MINYFFISLPEPVIANILKKCVSKELATQAKLYDGSYLIKVEGAIPKVLKNKTAYNHSEMLIEKSKREKDRPEI